MGGGCLGDFEKQLSNVFLFTYAVFIMMTYEVDDNVLLDSHSVPLAHTIPTTHNGFLQRSYLQRYTMYQIISNLQSPSYLLDLLHVSLAVIG